MGSPLQSASSVSAEVTAASQQRRVGLAAAEAAAAEAAAATEEGRAGHQQQQPVPSFSPGARAEQPTYRPAQRVGILRVWVFVLGFGGVRGGSGLWDRG